MPQDVVHTVRSSGLLLTYARLVPRSGVEGATHTPRGQVGVAFTSHPGLVFSAEGAMHTADAPPGAVYVTGERAIEWVEVHGPTEALEMHVDPAILDAAGATRLPEALGGQDAVVFAAASQLRAAHVIGHGLSDVATSTIGHRLAMHLARHYVRAHARHVRRPRLTRREVDAVYRLIRERPAAPLTLDVLARQVHRSVFDFARAFREATGLPPHRFVTLVRMHHALELLREGATVAAATDAVGYANRYHFRRQFQAAIGTPPMSVARAVAQDRSHPIGIRERRLDA